MAAVPAPGFTFNVWKVEGPAAPIVSRENPLEITISSNLIVVGVFEKGGPDSTTAREGDKYAKTGGIMAVCSPTVGTSPPPAPISTPTTASGPVSLKVVGQIGGPTQAVGVDGNYAYVAVGLRLVALDVSDPKAPRELGATEPLQGDVRDVAIAGDFAYLAAGGGGLYVVSLSISGQPKVIGAYDTPGYAEGIAVAGRYAYVADGPGGLRIIDIEDPSKPTEVAVAYPMNYAFELALAGKYAYVAAAGAGLLVADVSNPKRPVELGRYDTPGYAYGITVAGTTAYVADGWEGLQAVDISNPLQPKQSGFYDTPGWAMDVATAGARLYVADAYAGLRVLDVSDAGKPKDLGGYTVPSGHAAKVAVSGSMVYAADIYQGVHIVDVSTPAQPQRVGLYSPMGSAQAVAVSGRYAYVAAQTYGLRVIDLVDPAHPREVAAFDTEENPAVAVALSGGSAYVGTLWGPTRPAGLYALDISDPLHPKGPLPQRFAGRVGLATFESVLEKSPAFARDIISGPPRSVFIQGTTLYIASEWGLHIIDISNPHSPCELAFLQTASGSSVEDPQTISVAVSGSLAYLAAQEGGLYTVDVSNPKRPTLLGVFNEAATVGPEKKKEIRPVRMTDVVVAEPFAYVLDGNFLRVVDVSDPKRMKGLGSFQLPAMPINNSGAAARSLAFSGGKLFVLAGPAGLLVVDVADPAMPRLAGQLRLPGLSSWVSVDGKYVYVASFEGGLFIIEWGHGSPSTRGSTTEQDGLALKSTGSSPLSGTPLQGAARVPQPGPQTAADHAAISAYRLASPRLAAPLSLSAAAPRSAAVSACTVTSTADSGPGTLRHCLNIARGGDTITFDPRVFPPQNPATISLASGLSLGGGITIDGSNAGVILDGSGTPLGTTGLSIGGSNNVVKGLQILHFPGNGIGLGGSHNTIGGDSSRGTGPMGESNLISGNRDIGITLCCGKDSADNRVVGNYIGTEATGTQVLGRQNIGVLVEGSRNVIGGPTPADRNVVSGNDININLKVASDNLIVGNYIGIDASGRKRLGGRDGVALSAGSWHNRVERNVIAGDLFVIDPGSSYNEVVGNFIGTDATGTVALEGRTTVGVGLPFNRIGGTKPGESNVINGSVHIGPSDVLLIGNVIGTDVTGDKAFASSDSWVNLAGGSHHNFIGGTTAAERNVINGVVGVSLAEVADYNFIAGNLIGTGATGLIGITNNIGISIQSGEHNIIQGNLISGSQSAGVRLGEGASFNWLRANRITQSNRGIEIGEAEGNLIVGNSFLKNRGNGYDGGQNNRWDDRTWGNYWDDYTGVDADGDGIGDIPIPVPPNGVDRYPLIAPP